jgi:hypothetical protein
MRKPDGPGSYKRREVIFIRRSKTDHSTQQLLTFDDPVFTNGGDL